MAENNVPFSYETQQGVLKRRQSYIDRMTEELMRQQSPKFLQNSVATHYAGPGIGDAVGKVLSAYFLDKQQKGLDEESAALAGRYNTELKAALEQYQATRDGREAAMYPGSAGEPNPANAPMVEGIPAQPGDPRRAAIEAIVSSFAPLREIGMADLKAAQKEGLTTKDLLPYVNPTSIPQLIQQGIGGFRPKQDLGEVGGTIYDKNTLSTVELRGPKPGLVERAGDLYEISPSTSSLRKLDNAARVTTNVNIPKGESAFDKTLGESEAKRLSAALETLPQQQDGLEATRKGLALLKQGIHSGILAPVALNLDKLNSKLAQSDPAKAARTEEFVAYIGDIVIPGLKAFGGSDTVEEMKYLQQVSGGNISLEPQALSRILQSVEAKLLRKMEASQKAVETYRKKGYDLPTLNSLGTGTAAPAGGGKPSVTNW